MSALTFAPALFVDRPADFGDRVHLPATPAFPMSRLGRVFGLCSVTGQLRVTVDGSGESIYVRRESVRVFAAVTR
jgi:hypothetical protein